MVRVVRSESEWEGRLFDDRIVVTADDAPAWGSEAQLRVVGQSTARVEGWAKVTGQARYIEDGALAGTLFGRILRSPYPHARIIAFNSDDALALPGVLAVLWRGNCDTMWEENRPVFGRILRFEGDEVAAVAACDRQTAEAALAALQVEYEVLPHVLEPAEAMRSGAVKVYDDAIEPSDYHRGDMDAGFAAAAVVIEAEYRTAAANHNPLETHGSVCWWDGDHLICRDSTQNVFGVRSQLAEVLSLPLSRVRVLCEHMGGGFGGKGGAGKQAVIAALLARVTRQPVRVCLDRHEQNLAAGNRAATWQRYKLGATRDGRLTAIEATAVAAVGAYGYAGPVTGPARSLYQCPNVFTRQYQVPTHTNPGCAFRAPGYVEGAFGFESAMDELAEALQMDPVALRQGNLTTRDQVTGKPYSSPGVGPCLERAATRAEWTPRRSGRAPVAPDTDGWLRGRGVACQVWGGEGGPPAYALLQLHSDATATVITGTHDLGTGTRTILAQIAAEALGYPLAMVDVVLGDTGRGPYAPLSAGSMTAASVGPAVRQAAVDARQQLLEVCAVLLESAVGDLDLRDGCVADSRTGRRMPVAELVQNIDGFGLTGRGERAPNSEGYKVGTFGAQIAQVAIDPRTGELRVERLVGVHDVGRVLNPRTLQSQLIGGAIQGLGYALTEGRRLDPVTGRTLNADLENYLLPTNLDIAELDLEALGIPDPIANNLGAKGVGEPPIIPTAAAIANAVADAIGQRIRELPLSRARVLAALSRSVEVKS